MDLEVIDVTFNSNQIGVSPNATGIRDNPTFNIVPPITDCVGIAMKQASVPFTYYVVDLTSNVFELIYNPGGGLTTYTCTLSPGSYNAQNIGGEFIAAIKRAYPEFITSPDEFVAYVDNTEQTFIVYNTRNIAFTLNFNVSNSAFNNLAFEQASFTSITGTFYDNSEVARTFPRIESPRIINLTGPQDMYVDSDMGGMLFGKIRNQTAADGLIGHITIGTNYTGTIEEKEENPMMRDVGRCTISRISLKLKLGNITRYDNGDGKGVRDYLPLNGESFFVKLRFFRLKTRERVTTDSMGNSATSTQDSTKSSVFRTSDIQPKQVFMSTIPRYQTTTNAYDAQRYVKRSKK